jgi:hypothetical protein
MTDERGATMETNEHSRHVECLTEQAYHVYEVKGPSLGPAQAPQHVATCDGDSLAFTLDTLREERQIDDDTRIGILYRPDAEQPGRWLVNPYARGR